MYTRAGCDPLLSTSSGNDPLMWAALNGHHTIMAFILKVGIHEEMTNKGF
jgi:ankyrin repeat protein